MISIVSICVVRYFFLAPSSRFRGESDLAKYQKARKLYQHIEKIRKDYTKAMVSTDVGTAQMATAMYLIDVLALRVGNEKDTEEEADTVGSVLSSVCAFHVDDGSVAFPEF